MDVVLGPATVLLIGLVVFTAGAVSGLAGFGFAVVGTMALATVFEPATAVVFMIVPIIAVNTTLLGELSRAEVTRCWRRFNWLIGAALLSTIAGMVVVSSLPEAPLRVALGVLTIGFVIGQHQRISLPTSGGTQSKLDGPVAMVGVGAASGLVFGATNIGVQLIAYLRRFDLSHSTFIGVVAMVFVGINVVRVGAAGILGLYPSLTVVGLSVATIAPAVGGVVAGRRLRHRISGPRRQQIVLGILVVIGIRLVSGGV